MDAAATATMARPQPTSTDARAVYGDALKGAIQRLYDEGCTDRQIAEDLGVEKRTVRNLINRNRDVFAFRQGPAKRRNGVEEFPSTTNPHKGEGLGLPGSAGRAQVESKADARDKPEHDGKSRDDGKDGNRADGRDFAPRMSRDLLLKAIAKLRAEECTIRQIGRALNVNPEMVQGLIKRNRALFPLRSPAQKAAATKAEKKAELLASMPPEPERRIVPPSQGEWRIEAGANGMPKLVCRVKGCGGKGGK